MNIHPASVRAASRSSSAVATHRARMTRRQLLRTASETAALGGALGSGLLRPECARAGASFAPVPIPGGTPFLNGMYHFFGPDRDR